MRRKSIWKQAAALALALGLSLSGSMIAFAGTWQQDDKGWFYTTDDGVILAAAITPDGYWIGDDGYWVSESGIDQDAMAEKSLSETIIIYDKTSHHLELWTNGEKIYECLATAGAFSGDKEVEGDWKTPVGEFYVCKKNPNSGYHKALGLSYPNIEDAERGLAQGLISERQYQKIVDAIQSGGQPDWYTPLGGEIMIHGERRDTNRTAGCIGMLNSDIDNIWNFVNVGTKVIIQE